MKPRRFYFRYSKTKRNLCAAKSHSPWAHSPSFVISALIDLLNRDKQPSVRAAAAIALGDIGDAAAVPALSLIIAGDSSRKQKSRNDEEEFVVRSAVRSLGQIGSRAACRF